MKRKLLIILLAIACIFCLAFALTACNAKGESNQNGTGQNETLTPGADDDTQTSTKYKVTYNANGGTFADGETFTQEVSKNSLLTAPTQPTRQGYTFGGWAKNSNGSEMWQFATDKVTDTTTLYAVWNEPSASILSVEGASIDGDEIFLIVPKTVDSVSLSAKVICSSDSTWKLYYDRLGQTEIPTRIAAGVSGVLGNGNNVFYIVVTSLNGSQINTYQLTIHRKYNATVNYYDNKDNLIKTATATTGEVFSASYTPSITGYTFNNWKYKNGSTYEAEVIYEDLNLYAGVTAKTYTVTLNVNGGDQLSTTEKTVTYDSTYSLPKVTRTGYTFLGWAYSSSSNDTLTDKNGISLEKWTETSNKTLYANWQINKYRITLNQSISGAGSVTGAGEYEYNTMQTVTAKANLGYTWLGWYNGNELLSTDLSYLFTVGAADATLTAKWEIDSKLSNFIFASTATTCKIEGIKDNTATDIVVPAYVTEITEKAFKNCNLVVNLTIPFVGLNSGSNHRLGDIFNGFTSNLNNVPESLKTITVTGGTSIGSYAFRGCSNLTEITIPDSITSIGSYAFGACSNLTEITIPERITSIGEYAFSGCSSLTEITIPERVTSIGERAFYGCSSLESMTIPFVGATKNGTSNTHFGYIFGAGSYTNNSNYVPTSLKTVLITGGTKIDNDAFRGCSKLTSITIPDSVATIGSGAFYGCSNLTSITIPGGVTSIGDNAFCGCNGVSSISVENNTYYFSINNCLIEAFSKTLIFGCKNSVIPVDGNVTIIGERAFYGCTSLENIEIPDGVTSIGEYAFYGCSNLESMTIPFVGATKNGTSNTHFGYIFGAGSYTNNSNYVPTSLKTVLITGGTKIDNDAFRGCSNLTDITVPDSVTEIAISAFYDCTSLNAVYITDIVSWYKISFGNSSANPLYYAKILYLNEKLVIDLVISDSIATIGDYTFYNCTSLESIEIPDNVTKIGRGAFYNCTSLESIEIPDSVTTIGGLAFDNTSYFNNESNWDEYGILYINNHLIRAKTTISGDIQAIRQSTLTIAGNAFRDCVSLTSIEIPDSVTSIGDSAFYGCTSLESVNIGDGVTTIAPYAFYNCTKLKSLSFKNATTWSFSYSENMSDATRINLATTSPDQNATFFVYTYCYHYCKRG